MKALGQGEVEWRKRTTHLDLERRPKDEQQVAAREVPEVREELFGQRFAKEDDLGLDERAAPALAAGHRAEGDRARLDLLLDPRLRGLRAADDAARARERAVRLDDERVAHARDAFEPGEGRREGQPAVRTSSAIDGGGRGDARVDILREDALEQAVLLQEKVEVVREGRQKLA